MFIIREKGRELNRSYFEIKKDREYVILDTDDCVVETYKGTEIYDFEGILFDNVYDKEKPVEKLRVQGVGSYKIPKLLGGKIECSLFDDFFIESADDSVYLRSTGLGKINITDRDKNWKGSISFADPCKLHDSYIVWAERLNGLGIRIVYLINVTGLKGSIISQNLFLYLLYKNGRFYVEKVRSAKVKFDVCIGESPEKSVLARLSMLKEYGEK